jgi:hypothetical protein
MLRILSRAIAAAVLIMLCPAAGLAQVELRAPAIAVFGAVAPENAANRQRLNLTIDAAEAYDQNVVVPYNGGSLSLFQGSGLYTVLSPGLDFTSIGDRVQVGVTAGSTIRHYSDVQTTMVSSYSVGGGVTTRLWKGGTLSVNQGLTYSPALLYGLLAGVTTPTLGATVPQGANYALDQEGSYASATSVSITERLNSRAAVTVMSNASFVTFTGANPQYQDVHVYDGGGRLTYSLGRDIGLRFGYTYRQSQFVGSPRTTENDLDIGVDYTRPLSKTRKTMLTFRLGPVKAEAPAVSTGTLDIRSQYRLLADATLRHQMAQTWSFFASYHRGMSYIEGFEGPVFTGAYSSTLTGFLNRRTDVSMSAAYSTGDSALNGTPTQFTSYTGDARLRYAMGRMWAPYVEYVFYYYNFNKNFAVLPGIPPGLTRNGLRAGVMFWVPVVKRK